MTVVVANSNQPIHNVQVEVDDGIGMSTNARDAGELVNVGREISFPSLYPTTSSFDSKNTPVVSYALSRSNARLC